MGRAAITIINNKYNVSEFVLKQIISLIFDLSRALIRVYYYIEITAAQGPPLDAPFKLIKNKFDSNDEKLDRNIGQCAIFAAIEGRDLLQFGLAGLRKSIVNALQPDSRCQITANSRCHNTIMHILRHKRNGCKKGCHE
jgi:hypothetical protein